MWSPLRGGDERIPEAGVGLAWRGGISIGFVSSDKVPRRDLGSFMEVTKLPPVAGWLWPPCLPLSVLQGSIFNREWLYRTRVSPTPAIYKPRLQLCFFSVASAQMFS